MRPCEVASLVSGHTQGLLGPSLSLLGASAGCVTLLRLTTSVIVAVSGRTGLGLALVELVFVIVIIGGASDVRRSPSFSLHAAVVGRTLASALHSSTVSRSLFTVYCVVTHLVAAAVALDISRRYALRPPLPAPCLCGFRAVRPSLGPLRSRIRWS